MCTDVWASGLGALLIAANADDFVQKGHAWASQQRDAIAFLLEQKEKGIGYFNTDRRFMFIIVYHHVFCRDCVQDVDLVGIQHCVCRAKG